MIAFPHRRAAPRVRYERLALRKLRQSPVPTTPDPSLLPLCLSAATTDGKASASRKNIIKPPLRYSVFFEIGRFWPTFTKIGRKEKKTHTHIQITVGPIIGTCKQLNIVDSPCGAAFQSSRRNSSRLILSNYETGEECRARPFSRCRYFTEKRLSMRQDIKNGRDSVISGHFLQAYPRSFGASESSLVTIHIMYRR